MSKQDAYKQKVEAEMELLKANLKVLKAKVKILSADANLKYTKQINAMEDEYSVVKTKLHELGKASESTWENLKVELEVLWNTLSTKVKNALAKIKE